MVSTLHWLQTVMHCAHLDLHAANVMVTDVHFADGGISGNYQIKLVDFGVAEVFDVDADADADDSKSSSTPFECMKQDLTITDEIFQAPNVFRYLYLMHIMIMRLNVCACGAGASCTTHAPRICFNWV